MASQTVTILGKDYDINNTTTLFLNKKKLTEIQLTEIPPEIFQLTNLRQLDLGYNKISVIPDAIGNLTNLEYLNLGYNRISVIPDAIGYLTNLKTLILEWCEISVIPDSISNLTNLEYLDLVKNPLTLGTISKLGRYFDIRGPLNINKNTINLTKFAPVTIKISYGKLPSIFLRPRILAEVNRKLQHNGRMGEYVMTKTNKLPASMKHLKSHFSEDLSKYLMGENLAPKRNLQEARNLMNSLGPREAERRRAPGNAINAYYRAPTQGNASDTISHRGGKRRTHRKKHKKNTRKNKKKRSKMTHKKRRR